MHDARPAIAGSGGRISYEASVHAPRRLAPRRRGDQGALRRRRRPAAGHPVGADRRDRVPRGRTRHARGPRRGRGGQAREDRVHRQHQPRAAHAAAVDHRLLGAGHAACRRQHEHLAAMFTDIHAAGQRMLALVNDLLDVSKIESTVGTFHLERTDLRRWCATWRASSTRCCRAARAAPRLRCGSCRWWPTSTRCACSRCCATCWPTRSSSRLPGSASTSSGETMAAGEHRTCACATRARASRRASSSTSSRPSCSPARPRTARAAPAWDWPSAARSSRPMAAASTPRTWPVRRHGLPHPLPARGSGETSPLPL